MKKIFNARFGILWLIIISAGALRLFPHPVNSTPIGAMALFGGAYFGRRWLAFIVPLAALFVSDIVVNYVFYQKFVLLHEMVIWVYGAFILNVVVGNMIKKVKVSNVVAGGIVGAILFYVITNFGVWATPGIMHIYPMTPQGLIACYVAGIPYLWNTVAGNLFYSALMFGVFELAKRKFTVLSIAK
ncbi:MAG: hypothetical protein PHD97_05030 [Bacteroidales bacterium]|nr:hypothetical protein [Bacteroidales bacterium]